MAAVPATRPRTVQLKPSGDIPARAQRLDALLVAEAGVEQGKGGRGGSHADRRLPVIASRQYLVPVAGGRGQRAGRQINTLAALGHGQQPLWTRRNGYALCSAEGPARVSRQSAVEPGRRWQFSFDRGLRRFVRSKSETSILLPAPASAQHEQVKALNLFPCPRCLAEELQTRRHAGLAAEAAHRYPAGRHGPAVRGAGGRGRTHAWCGCSGWSAWPTSPIGCVSNCLLLLLSKEATLGACI